MDTPIIDNHDELFNRMVESVSKVFSADLPLENFTPPEPNKPIEPNIPAENLIPHTPNYEPVIKY